MIKHNIAYLTAVYGIILITTDCSKTDYSERNYEAALNNYYKAHPLCLWSEPKKFPVQAATSDESKTQGYDALTDAGIANPRSMAWAIVWPITESRQHVANTRQVALDSQLAVLGS